MLTKNVYVMIFISFSFGLTSPSRLVIGWVYFLELIPKKQRTLVACIYTIIDSLVYMSITIYFWVISKHWFYIILVGYVLSIITAVLMWFLPESPVFLITLGRNEEVAKVFGYISRINKKSH